VVDRPLIVAAAERPYVGETISGDSWAVDWLGATCRIAVIDGLGHGPVAAEAAAAAVQALKEDPGLGPAEALRRCHGALGGTRGAAISIAAIDPVAGVLRYAGVGNVEARLWRDGHQERPIAYRGIVGSTLPTIRSFDFSLGSSWLLLLHTDGVSARFNLAELNGQLPEDPQALAEGVLQRWARLSDDATVVVACPRQ
jgi:hypothetical protein